MKFPKQSVWSFWQTPALRAFVKRHTKIKTPQQALKRKELVSIFYFFSTLILINLYCYDLIKKNRKFENPEQEGTFRFHVLYHWIFTKLREMIHACYWIYDVAALRVAMLQGIDEGKIVKLNKFGVREVKDFDRDNHEDLLADAPFRSTVQ